MYIYIYNLTIPNLTMVSFMVLFKGPPLGRSERQQPELEAQTLEVLHRILEQNEGVQEV